METGRSFLDLTTRLKRRLERPLPGLAAQLPLAPRPRRRLPPDFDPEKALRAAVLALIHPRGVRGEPCLLLTRRTEHVATHKGDVCLPGGALDPGETALAAALRELEEELGVPASSVQVLGALTPVLIPVSGFRMEPFVGAVRASPELRAHAHEVEEVIEVPLAQLADPSLRDERTTFRDGEPVVIPHFRFGEVEVWGATAMVLGELAAILAEL